MARVCSQCRRGLIYETKISVQEFLLKMGGGLICEGGGHICRMLLYYSEYLKYMYIIYLTTY